MAAISSSEFWPGLDVRVALHPSSIKAVGDTPVFAGESVSIDAAQVVALGAALLADAGVVVTDRPG